MVKNVRKEKLAVMKYKVFHFEKIFSHAVYKNFPFL